MVRYSIQPSDWIFVEGYRLLSFTTNMGKNIGENVIKILSNKYSQKLLDHATKSVTDALQKQSFKKQLKQLVIWLVINSLMR